MRRFTATCNSCFRGFNTLASSVACTTLPTYIIKNNRNKYRKSFPFQVTKILTDSSLNTYSFFLLFIFSTVSMAWVQWHDQKMNIFIMSSCSGSSPHGPKMAAMCLGRMTIFKSWGRAQNQSLISFLRISKGFCRKPRENNLLVIGTSYSHSWLQRKLIKYLALPSLSGSWHRGWNWAL